MNVKEYKGYAFESDCVRTPEYVTFERQCRKELNAQAKNFGFKIHKFLPNHFEWSAVLEKDGKFIYVSMCDVRFWDWYDDILIRTMSHAEDWHGGRNNKCSFNEIGEYAERLHQWQMRQAS